MEEMQDMWEGAWICGKGHGTSMPSQGATLPDLHEFTNSEALPTPSSWVFVKALLYSND